jgi:hypothetical protein
LIRESCLRTQGSLTISTLYFKNFLGINKIVSPQIKHFYNIDELNICQIVLQSFHKYVLM